MVLVRSKYASLVVLTRSSFDRIVANLTNGTWPISFINPSPASEYYVQFIPMQWPWRFLISRRQDQIVHGWRFTTLILSHFPLLS